MHEAKRFALLTVLSSIAGLVLLFQVSQPPEPSRSETGERLAQLVIATLP